MIRPRSAPPLPPDTHKEQYAAEYYDILSRGHHGTLTNRLTGAPTVRVIGNDPYEANNVQSLVYSGQTFSVSTMTIDPTTDQGTLTVPNFGSRIPHVVLIVSAYAAETTLLAHYQLDVSLS